MVNIEPYDFQKKTNIKEHNDIVAKINEIVDVINNTNLDTILPKISKLETDVNTIKATDSLQWTDIENLKTKNTEYDTHFGLNDTQIDEITKSLVSNVALMNGTTTGNVKVRIGRENAPSIDSDDYNIQKPTSVELIQGSAPAMVKAQITLSDGTVLVSDDFMFTTEAIGTDVYISSFVFKNGNVAGTISADIGLSNGSTLTANNFAVPTDPNVTSAISDLQTRVTAVEGGSVGGLDELKATVDGHTASINQLDTDVANLMTDKADVENINQTITALRYIGQNVIVKGDGDTTYVVLNNNAVNDSDKALKIVTKTDAEDVDTGYVALIDESGRPKNFSVASSSPIFVIPYSFNSGTSTISSKRFATNDIGNVYKQSNHAFVTLFPRINVESTDYNGTIYGFVPDSTVITTYLHDALIGFGVGMWPNGAYALKMVTLIPVGDSQFARVGGGATIYATVTNGTVEVTNTSGLNLLYCGGIESDKSYENILVGITSAYLV